jgi:formylglycine-generating enzyme required for sulfatase activity
MKKTIGAAIIVIGVALWLAAGATAQATKPATQPSTSPATQASSQPGKELTLDLGNKVTMKLVRVPAGKFMMGSPKTEKHRGTDEAQHEVTISKAFYMGATHVTVDQFAAFANDSGYKTDAEKDGGSVGYEIEDGKLTFKKVDGASWRKPSFDQKGDHPVVQVSWNDAKAFCDWLSKKSGKKVALPTEAQWEYACRAGTKTAYPWGDSPDDGKGWANCPDQGLKKKLPNAPAAWTFFSWDDGFVFTSPVGSFKPNAFGLYDMIGNAWEWCSDWCDGDYYANSPKTDPQGPASGLTRVLRGGCWFSSPRLCRSAMRLRNAPVIRYGSIGFRVVVNLK